MSAIQNKTRIYMGAGPLVVSLASIAISTVILYATKWNVFYDSFGNLKNFGATSGETLLPAWLAMCCAGYFAYFVALSIM